LKKIEVVRVISKAMKVRKFWNTLASGEIKTDTAKYYLFWFKLLPSFVSLA